MPKIPRSLAKKVSDKLGNVRRNMARQATTLERQAAAIEAEKGSATQLSTSYRQRAESLRTQSEQLYASKITEGTGLKRGSVEYTEALNKAAQQAMQQYVNPYDWRRREQSTLNTLSLTMDMKLPRSGKRATVGSPFYAATAEIWKKPGVNVSYADRNKAIMDYFGVDSMDEAIEKLEQATGADFRNIDQNMTREDWYKLLALKGKLAVAKMR